MSSTPELRPFGARSRCCAAAWLLCLHGLCLPMQAVAADVTPVPSAAAPASGRASAPAPPQVLSAEVAMPAASSTSNAESKVQAVLQTLRNDPDLHPTEVRRGLRFKHSDTPADPETPRRALGWWHALGLWLSEQGRYLVWLLGMVAVAWLALRLWRYRHGPRLARLTAEPDAPSHVLALDIRPANLPDDIGQAAAALWHAGDARAALSLLYRAALSRLVHGRGVPLRGSSTEGEALALAHGHVDAAALAYLGTLVRLWQALVYAARQPRADEVLPLCQAFELHLSARVQAAAPSA